MGECGGLITESQSYLHILHLPGVSTKSLASRLLIHMQSKVNAIMRPLFPSLKHFVQAVIASLICLSCCPSFVSLSLSGSKKSPAIILLHLLMVIILQQDTYRIYFS